MLQLPKFLELATVLLVVVFLRNEFLCQAINNLSITHVLVFCLNLYFILFYCIPQKSLIGYVIEIQPELWYISKVCRHLSVYCFYTIALNIRDNDFHILTFLQSLNGRLGLWWLWRGSSTTLECLERNSDNAGILWREFFYDTFRAPCVHWQFFTRVLIVIAHFIATTAKGTTCNLFT